MEEAGQRLTSGFRWCNWRQPRAVMLVFPWSRPAAASRAADS